MVAATITVRKRVGMRLGRPRALRTTDLSFPTGTMKSYSGISIGINGMPLIYLSGPITGTSAREDSWRATVQRKLPQSFTFFDPSLQSADRTIGYLQSLTPAEDLERFRHGKFAADRNRHQIAKSDVLLCNLLHTKDRVSIGSIGEIHWANAFNVPIIVIRERQGNIHDHAIVNAIASELCFTVDDACRVLVGMFNKGRKRHVS